jgi:hypothetical protein
VRPEKSMMMHMNRQLKGLSKQKIKTSSITINFELSACWIFSHYDITLSDFVVQISDFTRNDISNVHVAIRTSVQTLIFLCAPRKINDDAYEPTVERIVQTKDKDKLDHYKLRIKRVSDLFPL